jgi:hypothetical protein
MILWHKVKVILRLPVRHPSGTSDQFFFLLEIFFRLLRVCYFVASSLTRERVRNLLLLLLLPTQSRGTQYHLLLPQFLRLAQPGVPGPRIYIPQGQGGPDMPPGTGFPFRRLLRLAGLRWRYSIPPPHGKLWHIRCRHELLIITADRYLATLHKQRRNDFPTWSVPRSHS